MHATQSLMARWRSLRLTTKMVNKGYYKGTGTGSMGRHTKHGGYIIEWHKVRTYVAPDLTGFKLTPFVTKKMAPLRGKFDPRLGDAMSGKRYINEWQDHGTGQ